METNQERRGAGEPPAWKTGESLGLAARGFAMGCADVVPGVSGGTIAFITGIYERFIEALRSLSPLFFFLLLRGRVRESVRAFMRMHWSTLVPMLGGIGLAVVVMARFITRMMETRPGETYAFFFGLILASCWAPFAAMKSRRLIHVLPAVATAALAFWVVGLRSDAPKMVVVRGDVNASAALVVSEVREPGEVIAAAAMTREGAELAVIDGHGKLQGERLEAAHAGVGGRTLTVLPSTAAAKEWLDARTGAMVIERERASMVWIFVCGMIAISAMMLPGISGSFLLLFLGQYQNVLGAISSVLDSASALVRGGSASALPGQGWWSDVLFLGMFGCGVVVGMATFSRVVSWMFRNAHDATMAGLAGFMLGALRQPAEAVWTASAGHGHETSAWVSAGVACLVGVILVVGLSLADHVARSRRARSA
ncbi:MAG: DUF368 domain-containing protein [Phycisphaerales bacterium]